MNLENLEKNIGDPIIENFKKDFLDRVDNIETFDEWDKRIIKLAFENSVIKLEIEKNNKTLETLKS